MVVTEIEVILASLVVAMEFIEVGTDTEEAVGADKDDLGTAEDEIEFVCGAVTEDEESPE